MGCCGPPQPRLADANRASEAAARRRDAELVRQHRAQLLEIVDPLRRLTERAYVYGRSTVERAILHARHFERFERAAPARFEGMAGCLGQRGSPAREARCLRHTSSHFIRT